MKDVFTISHRTMLAGALMLAGLAAPTAALAQDEEKALSVSGTAAFGVPVAVTFTGTTCCGEPLGVKSK